MTKLRYVLLLMTVVTAWIPSAARTQQPGRLPTIGILSPGMQANAACTSKAPGSIVGCFVEELRALGYREGSNVAIEYRFAEGDASRLPVLAAELVSLGPSVIFTHTNAGADAAASATTTIPIVVGPANEKTFERLAGNFARPAGNVTGLTLYSIEQEEKCLQLLKELAPRTSAVAILVNPDNPGMRAYPDELNPTAKRLGFALIRIDARNASELPKAFAAILASGASAIYMVDDAALAGSAGARKQTIAWAMERRIPVASSNYVVAADGGLVSLGTDIVALSRRAASYVHRILAGAKPADLPVERPTVYRLSVNRKTASALGLTIPQSLLLRADEVIQ